jgi:hypothetical protein
MGRLAGYHFLPYYRGRQFEFSFHVLFGVSCNSVYVFLNLTPGPSPHERGETASGLPLSLGEGAGG